MPYVSLSLIMMHWVENEKKVTADGGQYLQSTYLHVIMYSTVISLYTYIEVCI